LALKVFRWNRRFGARGSGIVYQIINSTQPGNCIRNHSSSLIGITDVTRGRYYRMALGAQALYQVIQLIAGQVIDCHRCTTAQKSLYGTESYTGGASGHKDFPVC
jgi:hypothetical protein